MNFAIVTLCVLASCAYGDEKIVFLSNEKFNNYEAAKSFCSSQNMVLFSINKPEEYNSLTKHLTLHLNYKDENAAVFINGARESDNVWYSYAPDKESSVVNLPWSGIPWNADKDSFEPYLTLERSTDGDFKLAPKNGEKTWGAACQLRHVIRKESAISRDTFDNYEAAKSFCNTQDMDLFSIDNYQNFEDLNSNLRFDFNYMNEGDAVFINGKRGADNVWYSYTPDQKKAFVTDLPWNADKDLFEPYLTMERSSDGNFKLAPKNGVRRIWGAACQPRAT